MVIRTRWWQLPPIATSSSGASKTEGVATRQVGVCVCVFCESERAFCVLLFLSPLALSRCVQSGCTSRSSVLHWEPASGHQSHGEGGGLERCHTALAGSNTQGVCGCVSLKVGMYVFDSVCMRKGESLTLYFLSIRCKMQFPSPAVTQLAPSCFWAATTDPSTIQVQTHTHSSFRKWNWIFRLLPELKWN